MSDDLIKRLRANSCKGKERDEMLVELGKAKGAGAPAAMVDPILVYNDLMSEAADALSARAEVGPTDRESDLEDALRKIAQWSDAYPEDVFLPPDLEKCRALLEAGGQTLDGVSGAAMRHVVTGVGKIAKDALDMNNSRSEG